MEVKELRIGNYINLDYPLSEEGKLIRVSAYHIKDILQSELASVKHNFLPIPLTEEWLLKFGFNNLGEYGWGIGQFHIKHKLGKLCFPIEDKVVWIKSVHQLQNLYFALTGKELN